VLQPSVAAQALRDRWLCESQALNPWRFAVPC